MPLLPDAPSPPFLHRRRGLLSGLAAGVLAALGRRLPPDGSEAAAAQTSTRSALPTEQKQRCSVPADGGSVDCSVRCPPGQIALSGGYSASPGVALSQFARLGANGWLVTASANGEQAEPVVVVKVYCSA